ncbi:SseB family protein [Streptosporangium soli]|nr:SseB family protein [Streptosporangium sp. KLBMP 9127]
MQRWRPASPFEEALEAMFEAGDLATCLALLRGADLALPVTRDAAAGREPFAWVTTADHERTWVPAYTSIEALHHATGDATLHGRITSLTELAAGWPDSRWGLAVNAGLPVGLFLESGTLARLAVPSLAEDRLAEPRSGMPIMQKLLRPADVTAFLDEDVSQVSGYCHHALDVAHIGTPGVLAAALGHAVQDVLTEDSSVHILRWRTAGLNLYRTPYGGIDEERMVAVGGWVIEEPPFAGLGLAPNVNEVIREYKVDGIGLPHGSEILELMVGGTERRRAIFDGDLGRWLPIHLVIEGSAP